VPDSKPNEVLTKMSISDQLVRLVWTKAIIVPGRDSSKMRKDACGAWIHWEQYGNRNSQFGWEVDHIIATTRGGSDLIFNLRPLHWQNNARKSDGRSLVCPVTASA